MARFDWKAAICQLAMEIEVSRMVQRVFPERAEKFDAERNSKASYAAWLARSYCRKGRSRTGGAV